jgi:hypothetical protein
MATKQIAVVLSVFLGLGSLLSASRPLTNQQPPPQQPAEQPELNTILMQSTFRLEGKNAKGQPSYGTAFLIGRTIKELPKVRYVLVTAAHVVEPLVGDEAILVLRRRVNGRWERLLHSLPIRSKGQPLYVKHPAADVVAMYVGLPAGTDPAMVVGDNLLADDKWIADEGVHPGEELMCLGFPLGAFGNDAGFPILRAGKIASYPLLPTTETKTFLLDFPVFQGNSGGPVYMAIANRAFSSGFRMGITAMLMGIVIEERSVVESIKELYATTERRHPLGLAIVAHASLIKEVVAMLPEPSERRQLDLPPGDN